jgi:prepilin-type N-terminal cleavage/methylation domain-containing protein
MRYGYTLPEMLLVLAVTGILLGLAIPSLARTLDGIEVDEAASHLMAAHQRARMMAIARGQVLVLSVDSEQVAIYPRGGPAPLWSEPGPAGSRVALEGTPRQFTFLPEGLTLGLSNATLQLSRGASHRTIVISRLGRVRLVR